MASNIALRRFKKAVRRKSQVAERLKLEKLERSLPAQISRALAAPIQQCLLQDNVLEGGLGMLLVARGVTTHQFALASFLLDSYCLGIKDVMFRSVEAEEFALFLDTMAISSPLTPVDPAYARKLLRDLAAWAKTIGFEPHPDFATVEHVLGDVNSDDSDVVFQFGRDGKPFYIPGPFDSPSLTRLRLEHLRKRFGDQGFDFVVAA